MGIKKRVLIVDDSALIRQILTDIVNSLDGFEVCGTAPDPHIAAEKVVSLKPDMMTLDIEMPKMDGLTFLEKIMRLFPLPVVIISSLAGRGSETAMKALELGAVDYVPKPTKKISEALTELSAEIHEKLKACRTIKVTRKPTVTREEIEKRYGTDAVVPQKSHLTFQTTDKVISIGASTGGPVALSYIFKKLNPNLPGMVVVIHMPAGFTKSFADRLNKESKLTVKEAENNDTILPGQILIAPGGKHLHVKRSGARYYVEIDEIGPPVNRHKPSVDVLFRTTAQNVGPNAVGVILTGMGDDGARAMREMKSSGAFNIAQDEATSLIYGMPKIAYEMGGVDKTMSLDEIVTYLNSLKTS